MPFLKHENYLASTSPSQPDRGRAICFFSYSRPRGPSYWSKPDRGRAPWACHIYYKPIVISHFLSIYLHNFFPEPHIDSDLYIHHFFKSVPRIIISTQILIWRAHSRHSSPWIMKNPEFQKFMKRPFQLQGYDRYRCWMQPKAVLQVSSLYYIRIIHIGLMVDEISLIFAMARFCQFLS